MKPRLPARTFYSIIVAGVLLGLLFAVLGGWVYLETGDRRPMGRRIWDTAAAEGLVLPICAMMGSTFGGLAGVATAVLWERRRFGEPGA